MSAPRNAQQRTWRAACERLRPTRACADASMRIMFGSDCASSKLSPISIESAPMRASDRACKRGPQRRTSQAHPGLLDVPKGGMAARAAVQQLALDLQRRVLRTHDA